MLGCFLFFNKGTRRSPLQLSWGQGLAEAGSGIPDAVAAVGQVSDGEARVPAPGSVRYSAALTQAATSVVWE